MIEIRQVTAPAAIACVLRMHKELFPIDPVPKDEGSVYWIAFNNTVPCAFAIACPDAACSRTLYLSRCGVLPSTRGQGLQRRLIKARLAYAKRHGFTWAVTDVRTWLPQSVNNLMACGFRAYYPAAPWGVSGTLYVGRPVSK